MFSHNSANSTSSRNSLRSHISILTGSSESIVTHQSPEQLAEQPPERGTFESRIMNKKAEIESVSNRISQLEQKKNELQNQLSLVNSKNAIFQQLKSYINDLITENQQLSFDNDNLRRQLNSTT